MDFAEPRLLWLSLLAFMALGLMRWLWLRRLSWTAAWAARGLWPRLLPGYDGRRLWLSAALLACAIAALVLALARPRWGQSRQQVERRGVDVVFVLDTSLSMATRDVSPHRLWVGQTLVRRLVEALPGHRVALVQAEGDGVVMVPLTSDSAVVDLLLDAVAPGSLPTPGTELAAALERALALFPDGMSKHQVMVLVSDGEDHGSPLREATEVLVERGVVLHAVGVGTLEGRALEVPGIGGGEPRPKLDENGQVVVSRLVESTLEELARATGGRYLRAASPAVDLTPIVERIHEMESKSYGSELVSTLEERFQWPLVAAGGALVLHLLVAPFRRGAVEGG